MLAPRGSETWGLFQLSEDEQERLPQRFPTKDLGASHASCNRGSRASHLLALGSCVTVTPQGRPRGEVAWHLQYLSWSSTSKAQVRSLSSILGPEVFRAASEEVLAQGLEPSPSAPAQFLQHLLLQEVHLLPLCFRVVCEPQ